MCMCNFACKGHPRSDLYCVRRDVKPYSLTHSLKIILFGPCTTDLQKSLVWVHSYQQQHDCLYIIGVWCDQVRTESKQ